MAYKFCVVLALLVSCNAALLPAVQLAQPAVYASGHSDPEYYSPAFYDFAYSVHDTTTGDIKSHHESRRGDVVEGQYSLVDPDGLVRIVDYHADDATGFNAHVRRQPGNVGTFSIKPTDTQKPVKFEPTTQKPNLARPNKEQQRPIYLAINQQQQQIIKPSKPIALQTTPLAIAQQSANFGLPVALATQSTSLNLGSHTLPLALTHHTSAPLAVAQHYTPLTTFHTSGSLEHQGLISQQAASLAYNQAAHQAIAAATATASPYAIAHTAPIAYHTTAPLTHLITPAALAIHR